MIQLITADRYGEFSTISPKCIGSVTGFSRSVSAGTCRSAATWKSTNSMPADPSIFCRGTKTAGSRAASGSCRQPAQPCFAKRSCALGRTGCAGVRRDLGKQPLRRRSLFPRGEDGRQHRASDLRALRRHDRVRVDAAAHGYRHRNGRADGADSVPRALAFAASRLAAADRKDDRGRRLPRGVRERLRASGSRRLDGR